MDLALRKNFKTVALYNAFIVVYIVSTEMIIHDRNGWGIFLLPEFLILATLFQCAVFLNKFFKNGRENFKLYLWDMFAVAGLNICGCFVNFLVIILMLNIFQHLGFMYK